MKLHPDAQKFRDELVREYSIDDPAGLRLVQTAAEAMTRMRRCQALIDEHGELIGESLKVNPLISHERDARAAMMAALKALNLDLEPLKAPGRPAELYEVKDAH